MSERGAGSSVPPPGAPPDAVTPVVARDRWTAYRAEVWRTLAEARGQGARVAILGRLRPGSAAFRVVTGVAGPVLAARRRLRRSPGPAPSIIEFPFGDEPASTAAPAVDVHDVATVVVGDDVDVALARANEEIPGDGWLLVLDRGDRLVDGAVARMVERGIEHQADLVYGDEQTRDRDGWPRVVARTGALSWISLMSYDATGRAVLFRRSALRAIGGFAADAGWAFRHDAVVRLIESGAVSAHVAATLVESADLGPRDAEGRAAVSTAALARRAGGGWAEPDETTPGLVRWRLDPPRQWPTVSVVVPTRDRLDLLGPCLAGLAARTSYPNYEVIIVDNDSAEPETQRYFAETHHRVVRAPGPFNYASVINRGVAASTGDFVVTLNNDVTVATDDWLEQMVSVARLPDVGIVGVYLEEPTGHAQHEGIAIAPYPQHLRRDRNYLIPDAFLNATREVSGVTGACQLFSRSLFDELGGLDETLAVVHNDTDFCLRAQRLGRRVVYLATVKHLHAESSSRGRLTPDADIERFIARWDVFGSLRDPWFPARWELVGDVIRWRRPPFD